MPNSASSVTSSSNTDVVSVDETPKLDADIAAQFRRSAAANQREINAAVKNNIELQSLVLSTIRRYQSGAIDGGQIQNLANIITPKKRKTTSDLADADEDGINIEAGDKQIGKQNATYSKWSKARKEEALVYGTHGDVRKRYLVGLPVERLNELMELAFGLKMIGETIDKVGDVKQTRLQLYEQMRLLYNENGRPLRDCEQYIHDGTVDFQSGLAQYKIEVEGVGDSRVVKLWSRVLSKTGVVTDLNDDPGPFRIVNNFSSKTACILSAQDTSGWQCSYFFPTLGRALKRRRSAGGSAMGAPAVRETGEQALAAAGGAPVMGGEASGGGKKDTREAANVESKSNPGSASGLTAAVLADEEEEDLPDAE